jgi:predicted enzyme related to lactoylglutathione lyase
MSGILRYVDAVTVRVPDLDSGLAFYSGVLGQDLMWRDDSIGAAGLRCPESDTELVLTTEHGYEPNWKVEAADTVAELFSQQGGRVVAGPHDIPIGRLAVLEDPFGNVLVVLDSSKGTYQTDEGGRVTGVS